jgi:hypothetical protein
MFDTIVAGSLTTPWAGLWDLALQSPESLPGLLAGLAGLVLVGASLASLGRRQAEPKAQEAVVYARSPRPARRARRRR